MTTSPDADDPLKAAFRALSTDSDTGVRDEDVDRVWRAVSGELSPAERHDIVDRVATDPAVAHVWRVAHELRRVQLADAVSEPVRPARAWTPAWIGVAAALVLFVGASLLQLRQASQDTFRDSSGYVVEPLVASDATLSRDAFVLRWKPGPEGSRYQVRVTTDELRVLTLAADLTAPELTVARERFSDVKPGTRVLWQIVVSLPGGDTVSSQTFVVRVE